MDDSAAISVEALRARLARAEGTLQAQQARLEDLLGALRALPDGIVLVDRAGRITELNLGALHLTGWTEAQWGAPELGRKAKLYTLPGAGKRQLRADTEEWARFAGPVSRILLPA